MGEFLELGLTASGMVSDGEWGEAAPKMLESHKAILPYLLSIVLDIAIFFALYRHRKYAIFVHATLAALCALTLLVTAVPLLMHYQVPSSGNLQDHAIMGTVAIVLALIQLACGILSRGLQCVAEGSSEGIFLLNRVHRINGWLLAVLVKVDVYLALERAEERVKLGVLAGVDGLLLAAYLWRRLTVKAVGSVGVPLLTEADNLKELLDLDKISQERPVGVFANYVYDISPLFKFHPMGFQIIASVRGREFDRFLFGSAPTERLSSIPPHAHSLNAISLLGPPLAVLRIPPVFEGLPADGMIDVRVKEMVQVSERGEIYEVRLLRADGGGFRCLGYGSVRQVGRYFALCLDDRVSRLYITASFLAPRNIALLEQIYFGPRGLSIYSLAMQPFSHRQDNNQPVSERQLRSLEREDYLPLLIKKYPGGTLTTSLIQENYSRLQLSGQRGQGLHLHALPAGRVSIFMGGTGIVPFGDLIDLLFKAVLAQQHPEYRPLIVAQNPILGGDPLAGFSFRMFLEEHWAEDIHPLTRAQLVELVRHPQLLQLTLKSHQRVEDARLRRAEVTIVNESLLEMLKGELERDDEEQVAQYWICCSPDLSAKLYSLFQQKQIAENRFVFL